jgi:hypothetical protein
MEVHDPVQVFTLRARYIIVERYNIDAPILEIFGKLHDYLPRLVDFVKDAGCAAYIEPVPG